MKRVLLFLFIVCSGSASFAHSNIAGSWFNQNQTLSIMIVDDPASPPFTGGEIWKSMQTSRQNKVIKTQNFELKCSGVIQMDGKPLASCKLRVPRKKIVDQLATLNFALSKEEGRSALKNFIQPGGQESILIKSGITDEFNKDYFMFEINWRFEMVGAILNKKLIFE